MNRLKEVCFITCAFIAVFILLSVVTYHATDPSWTHVGTHDTAQNAAGKVGAWVADILLVSVGFVAYLFPILIALFAWRWLYRHHRTSISLSELTDSDETSPVSPVCNNFWWRCVGFILTLLSMASLFAIYLPTLGYYLPAGSGGISGSLLGFWLTAELNLTGATLILCALFLSGATLNMGISWVDVFDQTGRYVFFLAAKLPVWFARVVKYLWQQCVKTKNRSNLSTIPTGQHKNLAHLNQRERVGIKPQEINISSLNQSTDDQAIHHNIGNIAPDMAVTESVQLGNSYNYNNNNNKLNNNSGINSGVKSSMKPPKATKSAKSIKSSKTGKPADHYNNAMMNFDCLNAIPATQQNRLSSNEISMLSQEVEQKLLDFGIKVEVVGVHPGPVITRFELALSPGMKAGRITSLSTDLARSLSAVSVRVVEVIPGKAVVGLEIPNQTREIVSLREVLESKQYQQAKSPISLALGKDISGHPVVVDLAKMPHLLVAGTTGSGKSVGLNAMLLSLLYKATPEEVRMILVDPKMLELSIYDGIPHLLTPVVTDMKEAANALRWCVAEMEKRYKLMAALGVRNLSGYNQKVKQAVQDKQLIAAPEWYAGECENGQLTKSLPMIVVVIDEFADMMMVVGKKVEQLIARIAQKARAAGIHLILATQRPSVNVITGLIKANIPTRIAFQVSSKIDSRTILDQQGAQQLLGHGDMLYLAPGSGLPVRVHGAFVADEEVHRVVSEWQQYGEPDYLELGYSSLTGEQDAIPGIDDMDANGAAGADGEKDALYDQAVQIVIETRKASISSIQRRLKIGYNRAARLVETMEEAGLVGPMETNGAREILIPAQES